jgi:hypothetical protein
MWVRCTYALAIVLMGCGGSKDAPAPTRTTQPETNAPAQPSMPDDDEPQPTVVAPAFPDTTRSLELMRTVAVRLEPADDAKRIGTVAVDTRVRWKRTQDGKGCKKPWVEIEPRGWVCADYLTPSKKNAMGREVPMLDRGELVPGIYGKITAKDAISFVMQKPDAKKNKKTAKKDNKPIVSIAQADAAKPTDLKMIEDKPLVGSVTVRQYEEISVGGKQYWKVSQKENEYVLRSAISQHKPSLYNGMRLGDDTGKGIPIAFVWPRANYQSTYTMNKANGGGVARQVSARTPLSIVETQSDKAGKPVAYRVGDAEWIRASDVRVFNAAPPPALLREGERWIDIDLDSQILVAFEGELPVYATMVSTGAKDTPTETGVYRMWLKESEADMKGLSGEDPYSVATVPWTQFFSPEKGLALHTAYWHDKFGTVRSHGCVNLAPKDARWLYFWSDPQVPPGWTMAAGVIEAPGSIVRVRTAADPNPPLRGYAIKVDEARRMNAPAR